MKVTDRNIISLGILRATALPAAFLTALSIGSCLSNNEKEKPNPQPSNVKPLENPKGNHLQKNRQNRSGEIFTLRVFQSAPLFPIEELLEPLSGPKVFKPDLNNENILYIITESKILREQFLKPSFEINIGFPHLPQSIDLPKITILDEDNEGRLFLVPHKPIIISNEEKVNLFTTNNTSTHEINLKSLDNTSFIRKTDTLIGYRIDLNEITPYFLPPDETGLIRFNNSITCTRDLMIYLFRDPIQDTDLHETIEKFPGGKTGNYDTSGKAYAFAKYFITGNTNMYDLGKLEKLKAYSELIYAKSKHPSAINSAKNLREACKSLSDEVNRVEEKVKPGRRDLRKELLL